MTFIKHVPCPKCGSRDNLAMYKGGSGFCFGCGYTVKPTQSPYLYNKSNTGNPKSNLQRLYHNELPADFIEWASKCSILPGELIQRAVRCSSRGNGTFLFRGADKEILLAQERLFPKEGSGDKRRYLTQGKPEDVLPIYYKDPSGLSTMLVIVEDCLSAIKIARFNDAMPCLSSDLSRDKLKRLNRLYGAFLIWLDGDMFHKAQKMATRLQLLGAKAHAVYTEEDPKYHSNEEIQAMLLTMHSEV